MKKTLFLFVFVIGSAIASGQDVIIAGVNNNRLLTWSDFSGRPDGNSPFHANTFWGVAYAYKGVNFNGDTAIFRDLSVTLTLDENKSWVKEGKQSAYLLQHEQGHFDIGLLCQQEIIKQIKMAVFLKADFKDKIKTIFFDILKKYHAIQLKYDEESDHSKNVEAQKKWNEFLAKELNR